MAVTILGNKKLQVELLVDESTKTQLDELNVKYDDLEVKVSGNESELRVIENEVITLDDRIDNIIVGTIEGASAQEIIDARQGEVTLGENITKVKSQLAQKVTKNRGEITIADLSQEVKEQMTGGSVAVVGENSVLKENVVDGQITASKIGILSRGLNLFNGDYEQVTLLTSGDYIKDNLAKTVIIPVVGGRTYYLRSNGGNRKRLAWLENKPVATDTPQFADYFEGDVTFGSAGITAPEDATYMMYMVSHGQEDIDINLQVTVDKNYPFFIGYDFLKKENIQGLEHSLSEIEEMQKTIKGTLYGNTLPLLKIDYTAPVVSDRTVTMPNHVRVFALGKRFVPNNLGTPLPLTTNYTILYINLVTNMLGTIDWTKGLPSNSIHIALIAPGLPDVFGVDIEDCEVDGELYIRPQIKTFIEEKSSDISSQSKYFFLEDLNGIYDKPSDIPDGSSGSELNLVNSNHSVIYDVYDDLVTRFPDYVTKEVVNQDSSGLDINQYTFTAQRVGNENGYHINVPKIIMISAIHGYEQGPAYSSAMFFKDLAENWRNKEQLKFLRWNVDFTIIPVANPYGFDNQERLNFNGVDLNREFGKTKENMEVEAQAIATMIEDNLDADFYIDYHDIGGGYPMAYTYNDTDRTLMNSLFRTLSKKWAKDYSQAPQDGTMMGYIRGPVANTTVTYASKHGIKSALLETPDRMPFANAKYDKITLETGTETLGNLIVTIIKSLK